MYKFIYAFLPAFLLGLTVSGLPRLDATRTRQKAKEDFDRSCCRSADAQKYQAIKCRHLIGRTGLIGPKMTCKLPTYYASLQCL